MEINNRFPGVSFPPILEDGQENAFWLSWARDLIRFSNTKKRVNSSAAVAISFDGDRIIGTAVDGFPKGVSSSTPRQQDPDCWEGMHLDAEHRLVASSAKHSSPLIGASVFCWPMLSSAAAAALLIDAGVRVIVEPDYLIPSSRQSDRQLIRSMAAEAGVSLVKVPMDANLGAQNEDH